MYIAKIYFRYINIFFESDVLLSIQNIPLWSEIFACNSPAAIVIYLIVILCPVLRSANLMFY